MPRLYAPLLCVTSNCSDSSTHLTTLPPCDPATSLPRAVIDHHRTSGDTSADRGAVRAIPSPPPPGPLVPFRVALREVGISLSGKWVMEDGDKKFFYQWQHAVAATSFTGTQTAYENRGTKKQQIWQVVGSINGGTISWTVTSAQGQEVRCQGELDGGRISAGEYFQSSGEKLGNFTGRRRGPISL